MLEYKKETTMSAQVRDESGRVLIEKLDFLPAPRTTLDVGGNQYSVTDRPPSIEQVDNGINRPYVQVVVAKPSGQKTVPSGRRGEAVEG
jgi:hypothetical protein